MIHTENQRQHEVLKEIVSLTMKLKAKFPAIYAHLDETPLFKPSDPSNDLKAMEDYRDTLAVQLKEGTIQNKEQEMKPSTSSEWDLIHPQTNNPDIVPQAIPPDCNPVPPDPMPQSQPEKDISQPSVPEIVPKPSHPLPPPGED
ncbi:MAG TPA: hypothetical protein VGO45_10815 [Bacteroidia bacterium]|jgi:hypothetical protein|nr:hypothetical protein [Bacteroidia bacterium]